MNKWIQTWEYKVHNIFLQFSISKVWNISVQQDVWEQTAGAVCQ